MILTDGRSSKQGEGMTEKVAELLKQARELPPEGRAAIASSLLARLDEDTVDEGAELECSGRSLDVWMS